FTTVGLSAIAISMDRPKGTTVNKTEGPVALNGRTTTLTHQWQYTVAHDCRFADGRDPARYGYLNEYAAGSRMGLPVSGGQRGGAASGAAGLTMAVNARRRTGGATSGFADLREIYAATTSTGAFDWLKGETLASSLGFGASLGAGLDLADAALRSGGM